MTFSVRGVDPAPAYDAPANTPRVAASPAAVDELRKLRSRTKRRVESLLSDASLAEELGETELAETLLAASLLVESAGRAVTAVAKVARGQRRSGEQARAVVDQRSVKSPMRWESGRAAGVSRLGFRRMRGGEIGRFGIGLMTVVLPDVAVTGSRSAQLPVPGCHCFLCRDLRWIYPPSGRVTSNQIVLTPCPVEQRSSALGGSVLDGESRIPFHLVGDIGSGKSASLYGLWNAVMGIRADAVQHSRKRSPLLWPEPRAERGKATRVSGRSGPMRTYQPMLYVGMGGTGCHIGAELERMLRTELCGQDEVELDRTSGLDGRRNVFLAGLLPSGPIAAGAVPHVVPADVRLDLLRGRYLMEQSCLVPLHGVADQTAIMHWPPHFGLSSAVIRHVGMRSPWELVIGAGRLPYLGQPELVRGGSSSRSSLVAFSVAGGTGGGNFHSADINAESHRSCQVGQLPRYIAALHDHRPKLTARIRADVLHPVVEVGDAVRYEMSSAACRPRPRAAGGTALVARTLARPGRAHRVRLGRPAATSYPADRDRRPVVCRIRAAGRPLAPR